MIIVIFYEINIFYNIYCDFNVEVILFVYWVVCDKDDLLSL